MFACFSPTCTHTRMQNRFHRVASKSGWRRINRSVLCLSRSEEYQVREGSAKERGRQQERLETKAIEMYFSLNPSSFWNILATVYEATILNKGEYCISPSSLRQSNPLPHTISCNFLQLQSIFSLSFNTAMWMNHAHDRSLTRHK